MTGLAELLFVQYPKKTKSKTVLNRVSPTRILGCPRGAFFDAYGFKQPLDPQSEQNFRFGTLSHEKIQKFLDDDGYAVAIEKEITYDDPPLLGYVDAIIDFQSKRQILEIKTIKEKPENINRPLESHVKQAMLYMHITEIHDAIILYESKATKKGQNPWKDFEIQYDKDMAEGVLRKGKRILKSIQSFNVPFPERQCRCYNPACFDSVKKKEAKEIWERVFNEDK